MKTATPRARRALSLLELILVIGLLGILIGLLLPAVQRVRDAAARTTSSNNLKQMALACHGFAEANGDRLPYDRPYFVGTQPHGHITAMHSLLPYLEQRNRASYVKTYLSPADPTLHYSNLRRVPDAPADPKYFYSLTSYGYNYQVLGGERPKPMTATVRDGLSQTLFFAEHYSHCGSGEKFDWLQIRDGGSMWGEAPPVFARSATGRSFNLAPTIPGVQVGYEPPPFTFQVQPCATWFSYVDSHTTNPTRAAEMSAAFKSSCGSRPRCDPQQAQTPHAGGMLVALGDGSVRTLKGSIAYETYWALVTPAGGEVPGDW